MSKPYYVTTPIYYINDVPHLGTAYTTIAADMMARYRSLRGDEAFFLTGTDEHGLKIERTAQAAGLEARAFCEKMSAPFRAAWSALNCNYSHFVRTTDAAHESCVAEVWRQIRDNGDLYLGSYGGWYCVGCETYYTEKDLEPGNICPLHKSATERISEPTYFFRLSKYGERLLEFYERRPDFVLPSSRLNEVKSFVRGGLEDLSVSRTTFNWGIPVPDDPAHVMYVWFDALFSYYSPVQGERRRFWPADLHLMGKDILRFHAVYWPAFLMSLGLSDEQLPKHIFAHGFLTYNGQKMSKTLRNTISPLALAEAFGVDTLRYYLMRAITFSQDGDFNVEELIGRYNSDLANDLGNLLNRVLPQCLRLNSAGVPEEGERTEVERAILELAAQTARACAEAFDTVQPQRALAALWHLIGSTNLYLERAAPWTAIKRGDTLRAGTILVTALEVLDSISLLLWPVMPSSSDAIRVQLGLATVTPMLGVDVWTRPARSRQTNEALGTPSPVFPKITVERKGELMARLSGPVLEP